MMTSSLRFHVTHADFQVHDKERFAMARLQEARESPLEVFLDVDEALDWLYDAIARDLKRNRNPDEVAERSGLGVDEDWEARREISRTGLLVERRVVGRATGIGSGWVAHAHVYPVET